MKIVNVFLTILCLILLGFLGFGQTSLSRVVISSGGTEIADGLYTLNVTIGQPLVAKLLDETSEACIGFWQEVNKISSLPFKLEKFYDLQRPGYKGTGFLSDLKVYPNPILDRTTIEFNLMKPGRTKICFVDIQGRIIETLLDRYLEMGLYRIPFEVTSLESGMYTVLFITDTERMNRSCIVLK